MGKCCRIAKSIINAQQHSIQGCSGLNAWIIFWLLSCSLLVALDVSIALYRIEWCSLVRKLLKSSLTSVLGHGRSGEVQNSNTKLLQRSPGCHFGLVFLLIWFNYLLHSSLVYLILIGESGVLPADILYNDQLFLWLSYIAVPVSCLSDHSEFYLFILSL